MPATKPLPFDPPFNQQLVKQKAASARQGPDMSKPHYRRRTLLPIPPEDVSAEATEAAGLHPAILAHNHSPGLVVCPNGDLLAIFFSASRSSTEYWPNVSFIASRLRYGAEEWDMPSLFYDFPDVNDQTSLLWNDNGTLWHFSGGAGLVGVPFRIQKSSDNGATWSPIAFPTLTGEIGTYSPQPINTAFRGPDGTIYVSSDGNGGESLLWASSDNGNTWRDTGGRSAGRHTGFVMLKNGAFLGMGGKSTDIDGYMPKAISRDGGKTWTKSKTPFSMLGSNQRPTLLRLASGRLFFAGDFQHRFQQPGTPGPAGITERGAYVALSEDEGETWLIKKLPGALAHESYVLKDRKPVGNEHPTLGYAVARQAANGVIHLITTMNHPSLHFELNEAWILDRQAGMDDGKPPKAQSERVIEREFYPGGRLRSQWSGVIASDGRYLLDGPEIFYHEDGRKWHEATYQLGRKAGTETYWDRAGNKVWIWQYQADGTAAWTQYWPDGSRRTESRWQARECTGMARHWNHAGQLILQRQMKAGEIER
jgi:hypothetical protein